MSAPTPACIKRLQAEVRNMLSSPPENCFALPDPGNILLWYYLLDGPKGTPYEGGVYIGKIRFPADYPYSPPSIMICTPNGRFKTDTRLCLSISDFHPKEWNPVWNSGTILTGLLSFMTGGDLTYGSMESTKEQKMLLAQKSHQFNVNFPMLEKLFPERYAMELAIVEQQKEAVAAAATNAAKGGENDASRANTNSPPESRWATWLLQIAMMAGIGIAVGKYLT
jgi:ubiquitin-conjugating enzyme E2 J2